MVAVETDVDRVGELVAHGVGPGGGHEGGQAGEAVVQVRPRLDQRPADRLQSTNTPVQPFTHGNIYIWKEGRKWFI